MALPASGQISVSSILTELGLDNQNPDTNLRGLENGDFAAINQNNDAADRPDGNPPHSLSEWYSYDHNATPPVSNTHYYSNDGVNDYATGLWGGYQDLVDDDWSISCWIKNNESTGTNMTLYDLSLYTTVDNGNNTNRVFLNYNTSLNRLIARVRSNGANFDRQWALHSNNSATGTGTNSGVKWTSSNRGNVNGDGFCHLVLTYDASQSTAASAFKMYWNGSELTSTAVSNNGTRTTFNAARMMLLANINDTDNAGNTNADIDEWALYKDVLTSSEASTLYNSGVIAPPQSLHTDNLHEVVSFGASNAFNTYSTNITSATISGGSTVAY